MYCKLFEIKFISLLVFFSCVSITQVIAQSKDIKGIVLDENSEPLIGASIVIQGTSKGVITDFDGNFILSDVQSEANIVISYVGFKDQIIKVGPKDYFKIVMKSDQEMLDEVVVVGYGTQKKANLSGSVSTVGSDVLESKPIVSAGQGLQGVIPNLNIDIKSGDPTQSPSYNVRGNTSINGGEPLILVDGLPMNIDDLNPNDIKSVTVLKDAGAAAIYGARAAFGVILVETKNASEGKVRVKFNTEISLKQPIYNMDPLTDPYKYVVLRNIANERNQATPAYDQAYVDAIKAYQDDPINNPEWEVINGEFRYYGYNDYRNKVLANVTPMQKYDLSLSGSGTKNKYYISFGFMDTKGVYKNKEKNEDFKRFNIIMKNDLDISDWISADSKIVFNGSRSNKVHSYSGSGGDEWQTFFRTEPIRPIEVPRIPGYEHLEGMYFEGLNIIPYIENGGRDISKEATIWMSQGLTLTPFKGFKFRADFSYKIESIRNDINATRVLQVTKTDFGGGDEYYTYGDSANDFVSVVSGYNQYYVFNTYGEYNFDIKKHDFKVMIGYNQEWAKNSSSTATAQTHASQVVGDLNTTVGLQTTVGGQNELALMGYFYRLNYSYDDRYLVELNGRYDGTSRFPSHSRFGFFPSFSAAWRISNEKFMEGTREFLDNLKLRASYGVLGNQSVASYYPYIPSMQVSMSTWQFDNSGYTPMVAAPGLVSPTLTWETVSTTNLGLDFTVLNQRLDVSFDIYERKTKDMLMKITYPSILGTSAPQENGADLATRGWELAVKWRDKIGEDFKYDLTLSLSDYQAEITKYYNPTGSIDDYYVGKKLGTIWGFETMGIFQSEEEIASAPKQTELNSRWIPGDIRFADLDGDNKISRGEKTLENHGDLKIIGNETPRYSYGLNIGMNYKNFSFSMFMQGVMKRDYMPDASKSYSNFYPYLREHIEASWVDECWSENNRDAYFPGPLFNNPKNYEPQSRFLQNAAYLRLKNLVIGYDVPKVALKKFGIESLKFTLAGTNLLTFSKIHKPLDPEYVYSPKMQYPLLKTYSIGLSLTF